MREIKINVPKALTSQIAGLILRAGATNIGIHEFQNMPKSETQDEIRVKTSTPRARALIDLVVAAPFYSSDRITISSHEIRSVLSADDVAELTKPFCMPAYDVYEDLWQNCHITASFVVRVLISAMLLGYGMLRAREVLMIGAMLFTVFSPPLMAMGLAISMKETRLLKQAVTCFVLANVISIVGAAAMTWMARGPLLWDDFGSMAANVFVAISASLVGAIADVDDAGRRQLIAIAAAFPYSRFPPWIGISLVLGFPTWHATVNRLEIFGANIIAMIVGAALTYWLVGLGRSSTGQDKSSSS